MTTILKDHALDHIWAEPLQDFQHRVKPSRVSPKTGFYEEAKIMWERVTLPVLEQEQVNRGFHVYPIGQLPLSKFALENMPRQKWHRADNLVMTYNTVIDLYADNGTVIPRNTYWLYMNYDNNLIVAVLRNSADLGTIKRLSPYQELLEVPYSLDDHGVTIRFYNSAISHYGDWLDAAPNPSEVLKDITTIITKQSDYTDWNNKVNNALASYAGFGDAVYYQDGFLISRPKAYNPAYIGSTLSFQFDETVKEIRFFNINQLPGFQSILDKNKDKYVLVSPNKSGELEFFDDCDFYLILRNELDQTYRGVMIDTFNRVAVRQVTHDAWSLTEDSVNLLVAQHDFMSIIPNLTIMVKVRNGGMIRGIGLQANRVEELYHLSYPDILDAMTGVNSVIPEWRAAELENSAYMELMGVDAKNITNELVEEAYGYNGATFAVAKSVYPVVNGTVTIDNGKSLSWDSKKPNPSLQESKRTLWWYDANGLFLGYTVSNSLAKTLLVPAIYPTAKKVEVISGDLVVGAGDVGTYTDQDQVFDQHYGFFGHRNYVCGLVAGVPDNKWIDVTGGLFCQYVVPEDGSTPYVQWQHSLLDQANYYPATRFGSKVNLLNPVFRAATFGGVVEHEITRITGGRLNPLHVPPGFITVFLNGKSLIENLDYYYVPGGKIIIVKKPDTGIDEMKVYIRFHGFMNPKTKKPFAPRDVGFTKNGVLSVNQVFNPWHDRDIRISVGGGLKLSSEVNFAEAGSGNSGVNYLDGVPYAVEDYQSLVEPFTDQETIPFKMASLDIDERMSAYLSQRLLENDPINNYVQTARHTLYSPVMASFIQLMRKNMLTDAVIDLESMDSQILDRYAYLVNIYGPYDPVLVGYDENYVSVHPHPFITSVEVTAKQYAFLEKINRIFLKSALDLTNSVTIKL